MKERRTYHFSGHVQGVGFRYTTRSIVAGYPNVVGYVRNLPDGGVELVIEAEPADAERLLKDLNEQMGDFIRKTDLNTAPATGEFRSFDIRH